MAMRPGFGGGVSGDFLAIGRMAQQQARISVLIADDHPIFREGLGRAIRSRPDLELLGVAADGHEALEMLRDLRPDVALIDVRMPNLDGPAVLNGAARESLPTKILLLTGYPDAALAYDALAAGASGLLSKDSDPETICDAVVAAKRGGTVLSPEAQTGIAGEIAHRSAHQRPLLSVRELQVLLLAADGHSAAQIGDELCLAAATIKTHLQNIYGKLGVSDRAAAVAEGMRHGLIE